jgi:hypothetical protein
MFLFRAFQEAVNGLICLCNRIIPYDFILPLTDRATCSYDISVLTSDVNLFIQSDTIADFLVYFVIEMITTRRSLYLQSLRKPVCVFFNQIDSLSGMFAVNIDNNKAVARTDSDIIISSDEPSVDLKLIAGSFFLPGTQYLLAL